MIKINVKRDDTTKISVLGHANYSSYGFDIICASVSTVVYLMKEIYQTLEINSYFKIEEGNTYIELETKTDSQMKLLTPFLKILEDLKGQFNEYIDIEYQ